MCRVPISVNLWEESDCISKEGFENTSKHSMRDPGCLRDGSTADGGKSLHSSKKWMQILRSAVNVSAASEI